MFFAHGPHPTLKVVVSCDVTECIGVANEHVGCYGMWGRGVPYWPVQLLDFGRVRDRRSDFHLFEWWLVESKVTAPCQNWIQEIQMTCAAFVIPWCSDDTAKIEVYSFRFRRFQTPNLSPIIFKNVDSNIPQIPWLLDFKAPFRVARTSQNLAETKDSTAGTTWA